MKKIIKIIPMVGMITFLILFGCSKLNNSFGLHDFSYNGCKSTQKSLTTGPSDEPSEKIEIKSENGYLTINHINVYFNCCPGKLMANASINDTTLFIEEHEEKHTCNCVCHYDLDYKIGPLKKAKYMVILNRLDTEYARFAIDYTTAVDTVIEFNHK